MHVPMDNMLVDICVAAQIVENKAALLLLSLGLLLQSTSVRLTSLYRTLAHLSSTNTPDAAILTTSLCQMLRLHHPRPPWIRRELTKQNDAYIAEQYAKRDVGAPPQQPWRAGMSAFCLGGPNWR